MDTHYALLCRNIDLNISWYYEANITKAPQKKSSNARQWIKYISSDYLALLKKL